MAEIGSQKPLPLNEQNIQFAIYKFASEKYHIASIPQLTIGLGISDLFSFTNAGYGHDFEVKTSLSDFKCDFKKTKHQFIKNNIIYSAGLKNPSIPNYLWYVAIKGVVPKENIPNYAGFVEIKRIYIEDCLNNYNDKIKKSIQSSCEIIINAPLLHKGKYERLNRYSKQLSNRYWTLLEKYLIQKYGGYDG